MKKLSLIIVAIFTVISLQANETPKAITVAKLDNASVKIATDITVKANETYEIQKSNDNKSFKTIAVLMGTEDAENMPAFSMKDKASKNGTTTYYRVIKINADNTTTVVSETKI